MSGRQWVRVTACENIPPREGRAAMVGDREMAIFNLGDRFLAVDNRCPHQGGPLCDGIVTGASVVCPLHGWKVNLETGGVERPAPPAAGEGVRTYATRVEDSVVLVEIVHHGDIADEARARKRSSVLNNGTIDAEFAELAENS